MKRVVIVGGGISGLATAHSLVAKSRQHSEPIDVTLLESASRAGGKVESVWESGYLCESGPNGFLSGRVDVMDLARKAGVYGRLLPSDDASAKRYIYAKGSLQPIPMSPPAILTSRILSLRGKLRILKEPWTKPADQGIDESVAQFAERHLGREAVDQLIGPFVTGVFAGDPEQMSLKSCLPVMAELEREGDGSLIRAMLRRMKAKKKAKRAGKTVSTGQVGAEGVVPGQTAANGGHADKRLPKSEGLFGSTGRLTSFDRGMSVLTDALVDELGDVVLTGQRVTAVTRLPGSEAPWRVWVEGNAEPYASDVVIIAAPAYAAAQMLASIDEDLARLLLGIPYVPVNVVNFGFPASAFQGGLDGFGFLIPFNERRRILGSVWTSSIFPAHAPAGHLSVRVMIGGARGARYAALDDEGTVSMCRQELFDIMKISADPDFVRIVRHERAIPQYPVGHGDRLEAIDQALQGHPGLLLTGNAYRGVSLPDCIRNGAVTADTALGLLVS